MNYGRQFTSDKALVKDCIQDLFCDLIDKRRKLGVAKSVKAYLFACLRRRLLDAVQRQRKLFGEMPEEEGFQVSFNSDAFFIDSYFSPDQKKLLEQYCNELPVRQREIIIMRFFEELSYEQIAEVMGLANAKTVRTMMYRGLRKLTESLNPYKAQLIRTFLTAIFLY